jgi:spore coat protein U-like protein
MMMNSSKMLNGRKAIYLAVSVLALGVGGAAFAGTASDNLDVSASIAANCTINADGGLAFGAYDPIVTNKSADLEGDGTISVVCTNGSAVTIELDGGQNEDGAAPAAPARRMLDGANYLSYTLYSDAGRTALWATGAAVDVDDTGTGVASNHTVYGSVAADQNVPVGNYADTVSATVTF